MPSEYVCPKCHLAFSLGWFHYHVFDSGYDAMTLLGCKKCGTQHTIEHALGPESLELMCNEQKPEWLIQPPVDRLLAASEPAFAVQDESKGFQMPKLEWITPWTAPFLKGVRHQDLADLPCHYCEGDDTLTQEWPKEGALCPLCEQRIEGAIGFWMT